MPTKLRANNVTLRWTGARRTLLEHVLRTADSRIAVVVNDMARLNVDAMSVVLSLCARVMGGSTVLLLVVVVQARLQDDDAREGRRWWCSTARKWVHLLLVRQSAPSHNESAVYVLCMRIRLPAHACKCLRSSARCARSTGFTSFSVGLRSEEDMLRELFKIVAAQHERPTPDRIAFILVSEYNSRCNTAA